MSLSGSSCIYCPVWFMKLVIALHLWELIRVDLMLITSWLIVLITRTKSESAPLHPRSLVLWSQQQSVVSLLQYSLFQFTLFPPRSPRAFSQTSCLASVHGLMLCYRETEPPSYCPTVKHIQWNRTSLLFSSCSLLDLYLVSCFGFLITEPNQPLLSVELLSSGPWKTTPSCCLLHCKQSCQKWSKGSE